MGKVYEIRYQPEQRPDCYLPGIIRVKGHSDLVEGDIISAGLGDGLFTPHLDDLLTHVETAQLTLCALGYRDELSGKLLPKDPDDISETIPQKLGASGLRSAIHRCFDEGTFAITRCTTAINLSAIDDNQRDLLKLLRASEHTVSTVAAEMGVTEGRVGTYRTKLFENLKTRNTYGAITLGYLTGLLVPGQE